MNNTNDFLAHYGVKGMKWGVRRRGGPRDSSGRLLPGQPRPKSYDHNKTQKIRKKKTSEMSNAELREVTQRMELEQKYKQLKVKEKDKIKTGQDRTKEVLGVAKTIQEIYSLANGPLGKAIKSAIFK